VRIISYSDGEKIQTLIAHEVDLEECRERLREDGFQIVKEDKMAKVKKVVYVIQEEKKM
jgi:hypothetical protein